MSESRNAPVAEKPNHDKPRQPGHPNLLRGGPGRPPGVPNKASQFVKELAQELTLQNPKYVTNLRQRLESGKCNPAVEIAILHYGYGKPTDKVDFEGAGSFIVQHLAYPPRHDPLGQPDGGEVTLPRTPRP